MVPISEIADPKNDFNLNIPRYIDSSEPEDLQDLHAHLHGGIPDRDIDALSRLLGRLPAAARRSCSSRTAPATSTWPSTSTDVQQVVLDSPEFQKFADERRGIVDRLVRRPSRRALPRSPPTPDRATLIATISDDLLGRFKSVPLLDEYDVYEQLMSYWHETSCTTTSSSS